MTFLYIHDMRPYSSVFVSLFVFKKGDTKVGKQEKKLLKDLRKMLVHTVTDKAFQVSENDFLRICMLLLLSCVYMLYSK